MDETRPDRRQRFLANIGPHKIASEIRPVVVPARQGVMAHVDVLATTACGREVPTTLIAHKDDGVRCPKCLAAMKDA